MSKEPATPPQAGGEPRNHDHGGANAAPSQPGTRRSRHAGAQGERQAVQGALHDGAGTSAGMAGQGGRERHVSLVLPLQEGGQVVRYPGQPQERPYRGEERPPAAHGGAGVTQQPAAGRPKPFYVPASQRRREQPYAAPPSSRPAVEQPPFHGPYPSGGVQEERLAAPLPRGGAPPSRPAVEQPPFHGRPYPFGGVQEERLATALPQGGARPSRPAVGEPPFHGPYPFGGVQQEERLEIPLPQGGAPPAPIGGSLPIIRKKKTKIKTVMTPDTPVGGGPHPHPHALGEAAPPGVGGLATAGAAAPPGAGSLATAGGAAQPYGGSATAPGRAPPRGRVGVPNAKTIQRVPTMVDFEPAIDGSPPPAREHDAHLLHPRQQREKYEHDDEYPLHPQARQQKEKYPPPPHKHDEYPHPRPQTEEYPLATPTGPSPGKKERPGRFIPQRKKKRRPVAICFTLCCILFWLLVVAVGIAVLLVYLLYHPQPPRLRVTTATLNAGYVDQLPPPHTGLALNSDLSVLATIYNPNTKVDVVLRYMQLDLYFQGVMIGTQAMWPPIHEGPGETELRDVHLVVSEVRISPEAAEVWRNSTTSVGLVELKLAARFHVQLNFGRWLPFRYWVRPSCTLWLDPPPGGALRRARCRKSTY